MLHTSYRALRIAPTTSCIPRRLLRLARARDAGERAARVRERLGEEERAAEDERGAEPVRRRERVVEVDDREEQRDELTQRDDERDGERAALGGEDEDAADTHVPEGRRQGQRGTR